MPQIEWVFFKDIDVTLAELSKATRKLPIGDVLEGDMIGTVPSDVMY